MKALILNNIGTPDNFDTLAVRDYLNEFLMDPDIISLPKPLRWILVKKIIVPRRASQSAAKYRKVWTPEGSPLMVWSERFAAGLRNELGPEWIVELGMRYGNPSTKSALEKVRAAGAKEVYFAPMFPQWAKATTESGNAEMRRSLKSMKWEPKVQTLRPFFHEESFVQSVADSIRPHLTPETQVLFSYHGLPESQIRETPGCLQSEACCERAQNPGFFCYRAHCMRNSVQIAEFLNLPASRHRTSFQSRLGPAKWIGPATDQVLAELGAAGKPVVVVCPSFVVDCLETLEEIGLEGRRDFLRAGGKEYTLVPCLNDDADWIVKFAGIVRRSNAWM